MHISKERSEARIRITKLELGIFELIESSETDLIETRLALANVLQHLSNAALVKKTPSGEIIP